ncbi:hypothetical protein HOL46_00195, partial [Candidatus Falkowbacteria bacterium]|nr:hypothetical protein [Candidatus Falkowbacteria bacterium]
MKYLLCMFVLILLTIPFDLYCYKANAALVSNNISHSEVDQFIVLNCQTDECQGWFSELILNMNEEGQEDLAEEPDLSSADEEAGSSPSTASAEAPAVKKEEGKEVEDEEPITYLPGQVLINEIMSAPLPGDPEWVELFNSTNEPIDLTNWVLLEGAGKQTQLTGQLSAGDYIVFDKSSLNNGGDSVVLQDPSGQVIDQVSYGDWNDGNVNDNAPAAESGNSLIWHESEFKQSETATPGQMNIFYEKIVEIEEDSQVSVEEPEIPAVVEDLVVPEVPLSQPEIVVDSPEEQPEPQVVYQFSDKVIISEFMADPEGSDDEEWIELYNASDEDLNLLGWSLDDAEGGSNPFVIKDNLIIKSQDYLVIKKEESGLVLNNSSDSVRLLDPNLKLIDQYEYQNPKTGSSFSWFEDGWLQTSELTPAQVNEKPVLQTANYKPVSQGQGSFYKTVTIEQIKDLKKGSKVRIQGVVTVLPGVFGKNYIYVNGLQVYYSSADWPELQIGNQIEVSGSVSESYGEKRILVKAQADIKVLELQTEVVPLVVKSL